MTTDDHPVITPKKLIEVALPLDAINAEGTRRKRKAPGGYPTAFHKWWAPRPVAAARAVVFAQLVNDPEDQWRCQNPKIEPKPQNRSAWTRERTRLFKIMEELILWENTGKETVFEKARAEIYRSWEITCVLNSSHPRANEIFNPKQMPILHDPFAGSGAIPLESARMGLATYASDLNPIAVLINKAMIEIPPLFHGMSPVGPPIESPSTKRKGGKLGFREEWPHTTGLAEDVRRYAEWIACKAKERVGSLYPEIEITKDMARGRSDLDPYVGKKLRVSTWLWARTAASPNPAYTHVNVPLVSSFVLCSKKGRKAYIRPSIGKDDYEFRVEVGEYDKDTSSGTTAGKRQAFRCLMSDVPISYDYLRNEGKAGRLGRRLMAIVVEAGRGRIYLSPTKEHENAAKLARPTWRPSGEMPKKHRNFQPPVYGICSYGELFDDRQLVALTTVSDLIAEVSEVICKDAIASGMLKGEPLANGGREAQAYSEAICAYLSVIHSRVLHYLSSNSSWLPKDSAIRSAFGKQALPMVWDYAEGNPFAQNSAGWKQCTNVVSKCIEYFPTGGTRKVEQEDASNLADASPRFFSTDPPYYDNISYADLSDFFYPWLRRTLRNIFPKVFATIDVPKTAELIASPTRHGGPARAEEFFLDGMARAMAGIADRAHLGAPVAIYYAFKQSETKGDLTNSTGWETFLEAVVRAGFTLTGTWPMRTEADNRQVSQGTNSLASSVVLVCRPRLTAAGTIGRRQFIRQLNETLPAALDAMTRVDEGLHSPVAPVDLSQAIIGPGMAIFSKYDAVLEADGTPMTVKTALQLINRFLAEDDFDGDTQFCLAWFDQHGWDADKFGEADTLARAKGTSVDGVKHAGIIEAGGGSVRLLRWKEYPADWDPASDPRLPIWEVLHHMIRLYQTEGDDGAAKVLAHVASKSEAARQLAYRLYTLCERKGWAEDARAYNAVVAGWSAIEQTAAKMVPEKDRTLFEMDEVSS